MDKSHILSTDNLSFNDAPELVWIRVQDAVKLLWNENPKLHNIGDLVKSIEKYGYQEIAKFDKNLINVNGTTGAVVAGNGRIESLAEMEKQKRKLPRGLALLKETGEWVMPVIVGVDQENINKAKAFAIDSNNLGLSGGDFTAVDMSRMWNPAQYMAILQGLSIEDEAPVTVDKDIINRLNNVLSEDYNNNIDYDKEWQGMPEFHQEDLTGYQSIHVHFKTKEDVISFAELIDQKITDKTRAIWFPEAEQQDHGDDLFHDES